MTKNKKDSIYKYTKLEYVVNSLKNGIHASYIENMNDPFEYYQIENKHKYILCCLTRSLNSKLMWSHYANGHNGCLLKIKIPANYQENSCILRRVTYSSKFETRINLSCNDVVSNLYIKDKKWQKELEVRAVANVDNIDKEKWKIIKNDNGENDYYLNIQITQIILGCSVDVKSEVCQSIFKYIKEINAYIKNKKDKIIIKKMKISENKFQIILDKSFDYLKCIK